MLSIASLSRFEHDLVIYTKARCTVLEIRAHTRIDGNTFEIDLNDEKKRNNALFVRFEGKSFEIESVCYSFNIDGIE